MQIINCANEKLYASPADIAGFLQQKSSYRIKQGVIANEQDLMLLNRQVFYTTLYAGRISTDICGTYDRLNDSSVILLRKSVYPQ